MDFNFNRNTVVRDFAHHVSKYKVGFHKRLGMDIVMGKREGIYFHDEDGKRFIDCHCNGGVFNLGHRNPGVSAAVLEAIEHYDIGNHNLISGPRARLAKQLSESFLTGFLGGIWNDGLESIVFGVSGGEAADLAIKIARGHTGRARIVSIGGGYHGHTGLALGAGDPRYREPFGIRLADFRQVPFGNWSELEAALDEEAAGLIIEPIVAAPGMLAVPQEQMRRLRRICTKKDIVLIMDETQTGLGRTGRNWGFQNYGVAPDIVITGKGLSGGIYPMAATCFRKKYEGLFKEDPFIHLSTFGGAELGCFAALEALEQSTNPGFLEEVRRRGDYFRDEFEQLQKEYSEITEFRGMGMFMALVFDEPATCLALMKILYEKGIHVTYAPAEKRVMQFLPPLTTTREQAEEIMALVREALGDMRKFKNRVIKKAIGVFMSS